VIVLMRGVPVRRVTQLGMSMIPVRSGDRTQGMRVRVAVLVVVLVRVRMAVHGVAVAMLMIVQVGVHVPVGRGARIDRRVARFHRDSPKPRRAFCPTGPPWRKGCRFGGPVEPWVNLCLKLDRPAPSATLGHEVPEPGRRAASLLVERLTCRHAGRVAVEDVNLAVRAGERVALVGGNGSGKTTLLRAILGLHRCHAGRLDVDGGPLKDWTAWRRRVAWIPQFHARGAFPLRVGELIESVAPADLIPEALERFSLHGLGERLTSELSGGQRQRAYLARAWAAIEHRAGMLLADEPTASLDFESRDRVADWIATLPVSAIVVTHDAAVAARCDRVLEMAAGRVREMPR
jgi:ABC-type Mn2+/Zn2+ transport system ATPase subunit